MRRRRRPRNPIWTFTLTWLFLSFLVNFRGLGLLLALGTAGLAAYIFGSTPAKSAEQRQREEEAKRRQEAYARAQSENPTRRKTVNTVVEGQYREAGRPSGTSASQRIDPENTVETNQKKEKKPVEKKSYGPEIDPIIEEGNKALSEMGRLYMSIKDDSVKAKINEIIHITDKIVQDAIADPSDVPRIKKFLKYYLPTTIKLLNAYDRMDSQGIEGENLSKTKQNISEMLDTTVEAYKKYFDSLFENQALDIETDIEVMQKLLAREGLAGEKDFNVKPSPDSSSAAAAATQTN